ncbi:hypothetical protein BX666DRAFT_2069045 [Dichotomocladium elegans]|nr:hypothetical protein BX666DRAFT_2069045 [Dichotomocladium elegans]
MRFQGPWNIPSTPHATATLVLARYMLTTRIDAHAGTVLLPTLYCKKLGIAAWIHKEIHYVHFHGVRFGTKCPHDQKEKFIDLIDCRKDSATSRH